VASGQTCGDVKNPQLIIPSGRVRLCCGNLDVMRSDPRRIAKVWP
jgi:hypothetical protein